MFTRKNPILEVRLGSAARPTLAAENRGHFEKLERAIVPQMLRATDSWLRTVVQDTFRTGKHGRRTGKTEQQMLSDIRTSGTRLDTMRAVVPADPWVFVLEYGARLRPKVSRYLAVPMPPALHPDGRPKRSGPKAWSSMSTFVLKMKDGRKFIAYRNKNAGGLGVGSASGSLVVLYRLVDAVTIPAGLGLRATFDRSAARLIAAWRAIIVQEMSNLDFYQLMNDARRARAVDNRLARVQISRTFRPRRT